MKFLARTAWLNKRTAILKTYIDEEEFPAPYHLKASQD